jgi:hypothetical protein
VALGVRLAATRGEGGNRVEQRRENEMRKKIVETTGCKIVVEDT